MFAAGLVNSFQHTRGTAGIRLAHSASYFPRFAHCWLLSPPYSHMVTRIPWRDPSLEQTGARPELPAQNDALVPAMDIPTSENWGDELPTVPEGSRLPQ